MGKLTITAKRQATLPKELCEELGIEPGDRLGVERRVIDGEAVWLLRPGAPDWSWFGAARRHVRGRSHRWSVVRASIERGWAGDRRF